MINSHDLTAKVIGYTGGVAIKRVFGVDTRAYDWVKDFVKDEEIRAKIKSLKEKIVETKALPIHKDELRTIFDERVKSINSFRLKQLKANLTEFQNRKALLINELIMDHRLILGAKPYPFLIAFSSEELKEIFSELQEGVKQAEIDQTVEICVTEINKLEAVIDRDLSPQSRWFHKDNGTPIVYPQGCRWTPFVETWRKVVARFEGRVDIEGFALKNGPEIDAYHLLELDRVAKRTPLKEPYREETR